VVTKSEAEVIDEKIQNLLVVMGLLLLIVANASPAVADSGGFPLVLSHDITMQVQSSSCLLKVADSSASSFIEIGKELSKPPVTIINSIAIKQLPAIPATFLMVLTGFLCVSFVKDRKIWMRIVSGALYLGVASVNVVPQLLANCNKIKIVQPSAKEAGCEHKDFIIPTSDVQIIRYIGLLRRMATAGDGSFVDNHGKKTIIAHQYSSDVWLVSFLLSAPSSLHSYLSAIIKSLRFSLAYLSVRTSDWWCSSQVFTSFDNFAHRFAYLLKSKLPVWQKENYIFLTEVL